MCSGRQLHSELFGRRHSTLHSDSLFALAKPLLVLSVGASVGVHICESVHAKTIFAYCTFMHFAHTLLIVK